MFVTSCFSLPQKSAHVYYCCSKALITVNGYYCIMQRCGTLFGEASRVNVIYASAVHMYSRLYSVNECAYIFIGSECALVSELHLITR